MVTEILTTTEMMPRIKTLKSIVVGPDEPILIGDVISRLRPGVSPDDFARAVAIMVASSFKANAKYIDSLSIRSASKLLVDQVLSASNRQQTVVLFPGLGARSFLDEAILPESAKEPAGYFIPTNREVIDGKVKGVNLYLSKDLLQSLVTKEYTAVTVIDDVVATGMTLQTIKSEIDKYSPKPLTFRAVSWFCREPTNLFGYETVTGIYRYSSTEGYPALNSLSTMLQSDDKSRLVLERFTKRFVRYPYGFYKQLENVKNLLQ